MAAAPGALRAIFIGEEAAKPLRSVRSAVAVAGRGLEGDRYFLARGAFSATPGTGRHVTLIEAEALEALRRDYKIALPPRDARRNLLTEGVALNHLVGRRFRVGDVLLQGMRLCEPCSYLEKLLGRKVRAGLIHRGGLRAEVVGGGTLRVGDAISDG